MEILQVVQINTEPGTADAAPKGQSVAGFSEVLMDLSAQDATARPDSAPGQANTEKASQEDIPTEKKEAGGETASDSADVQPPVQLCVSASMGAQVAVHVAAAAIQEESFSATTDEPAASEGGLPAKRATIVPAPQPASHGPRVPETDSQPTNSVEAANVSLPMTASEGPAATPTGPSPSAAGPMPEIEAAAAAPPGMETETVSVPDPPPTGLSDEVEDALIARTPAGSPEQVARTGDASQPVAATEITAGEADRVAGPSPRSEAPVDEGDQADPRSTGLRGPPSGPGNAPREQGVTARAAAAPSTGGSKENPSGIERTAAPVRAAATGDAETIRGEFQPTAPARAEAAASPEQRPAQPAIAIAPPPVETESEAGPAADVPGIQPHIESEAGGAEPLMKTIEGETANPLAGSNDAPRPVVTSATPDPSPMNIPIGSEDGVAAGLNAASEATPPAPEIAGDAVVEAQRQGDGGETPIPVTGSDDAPRPVVTSATPDPSPMNIPIGSEEGAAAGQNSTSEATSPAPEIADSPRAEPAREGGGAPIDAAQPSAGAPQSEPVAAVQGEGEAARATEGERPAVETGGEAVKRSERADGGGGPAVHRGDAPPQPARAAETAPAGQSAVKGDAADVLSQIVRGVGLGMRDGRTSMSLRLEPPTLGSVRLDVTMERNNIAVRIRIETEAVQQTLADSLPELREALGRQGMNVQDISLALDQDSDASAFYRGDSDLGRGRSDAAPFERDTESGREDPQSSQPAATTADGRRVDFFA